MDSIRERVEYLTDILNYHNYKYYVEDSPEISDFEFDALLKELEELDFETRKKKKEEYVNSLYGNSDNTQK